jgi:hypothetical protein
MRKELTIEHLAAYLPYGVKVSCSFFEGRNTHVPLVVYNPYSDMRGGVSINQVAHFSGKLLLRPLSQLTETIEHGGERFVPLDRIRKEIKAIDGDTRRFGYAGYNARRHMFQMTIDGKACGNHSLPYWIVQMLHSLHFDTNSLIESGLAEPIPSIEQP